MTIDIIELNMNLYKAFINTSVYQKVPKIMDTIIHKQFKKCERFCTITAHTLNILENPFNEKH